MSISNIQWTPRMPAICGMDIHMHLLPGMMKYNGHDMHRKRIVQWMEYDDITFDIEQYLYEKGSQCIIKLLINNTWRNIFIVPANFFCF